MLIIWLLFISAVTCSCHTEIRQLNNILGKRLATGKGPYGGTSELILYSDSTFKYVGSGVCVNYSTGKWNFNKKKSGVILRSFKGVPNRSKGIIDTLFVEFVGEVIRFKRKGVVEFRNEVYKLIEFEN
jgi:hypothetical protein